MPGYLKKATIVPGPKKKRNPTSLNCYHPVALTPVLMKCFEGLVMHHIKSFLPANLDPLQFAYKANCSTEGATTTITLHSIPSHLEGRSTYAEVLFIDFSSTCNEVIPQQLVEKRTSLNMGTGICIWILSFRTQQQQAVQSSHLRLHSRRCTH